MSDDKVNRLEDQCVAISVMLSQAGISAMPLIEGVCTVIEQRERLAQAIRDHRSAKADDRCIEDDDALYAALGDGIPCDRRVGDKAAMLRNCQRFIDNRCEGGGWASYEELESRWQTAVDEIDRLKLARGEDLRLVAAAMRKLLTRRELRDLVDKLDPLSAFVRILRDIDSETSKRA